MAEVSPGIAAVIGAGTMGHGIAQVLALAGWTTRLHDPDPAALARARAAVAAGTQLMEECGLAEPGSAGPALERLIPSPDLGAACAGAAVVIESIPERLELKQELFGRLEKMVAGDTLLCTNTSGIPIGQIARDLATPERVVGTHFWNPAEIVPCVEVIQGPATSRATLDRAYDLMAAVGKEPVRVLKDVPGFLGNRMQHALQREALALVEAGVASPEDVDRVAKYGFGLRLALMGPLERADLGGLDTTTRVSTYLWPDLDARPQVSPLLTEKVDRGDLGIKTGRGFYDWPPERREAITRRRDQGLLGIIKLLKDLDD